MNNRIWRVIGHHEDDDEFNVFETYFTNKEAAVAACDRGEKEFGKDAGYRKMCWYMESFVLDSEEYVAELFEDVRETLEED